MELRGLEPPTLTLPGSGQCAGQGDFSAGKAVHLVRVVPDAVIVVVKTVVSTPRLGQGGGSCIRGSCGVSSRATA